MGRKIPSQYISPRHSHTPTHKNEASFNQFKSNQVIINKPYDKLRRRLEKEENDEWGSLGVHEDVDGFRTSVRAWRFFKSIIYNSVKKGFGVTTTTGGIMKRLRDQVKPSQWVARFCSSLLLLPVCKFVVPLGTVSCHALFY